MTALPLECQSAFDAAVELLRHPMVGDALMKLTVDNMIVHTRTSAILRVCAYHEMPWVGELCEHVKDHERGRDEPASSRKRKEPERSHDGVPSIKRKVVDTIYMAIDMTSSILATSRTNYNQFRQLQSMRFSWQGEVDVLTHKKKKLTPDAQRWH